MSVRADASLQRPLLGCIADDFTGGTDLAGMLVANGMRTLLCVGVPRPGLSLEGIDAVVVALKSRTTPVEHAVGQSMAAFQFLRDGGCGQFFLKYCSTFDSTPVGNIGPVMDALMTALDTSFSVSCPAFPTNGRTVFKGHLFVGRQLLSSSSMRDHPLTPMRDANLVRVLQQQSRQSVGLVTRSTVAAGTAAVHHAFDTLRANGTGVAILDAVDDDDLVILGEACAGLTLVTGGSGLGFGLATHFRRNGQLSASGAEALLPFLPGYRAVVAGSSSSATNAQVASMKARCPSFAVDPLALARGEDIVGQALGWAAPLLAEGPVLVYATASPAGVRQVQSVLGVDKAGALVEAALAAIARGLVALGVDRLVVAGGETSGAVVQALGITRLHIGREIAPGVPWTVAERDGPANAPLLLALKSGNFGGADFFADAWNTLP